MRSLHPLVVAIVATLALGGLKLAVALISGSHAVLASAADSLSDAAVSGVNLLMMRQAAEPPDDGHPWGHGKAEALASLAQAVVLAGVVAAVGYSAISSLVAGEGVLPQAGPAMVGMALSMVGSLSISTFLSRAAARTGSLVLKSDAVHYRMDLLTSAAVMVGLLASHLWGWPQADAVAALFVSILMAREVWGLGREAVDELMDRPLPSEEVLELEAALKDVAAPVLGWHDLRTRRAGPMRFVQVHVVLPADLPFEAAHRASHDVEDRLRAALPNVDVIVHADVEGEA